MRKFAAFVVLFFVFSGSSFALFYVETVDGKAYDITSNSCAVAVVELGYQSLHPTPVTCSTDPIGEGTVITYGYLVYPFGPGDYQQYTDTVNYIEEWTPQPVDITETQMLTVVLVIVSLFFSGVAGYRQGASS